MSAEPRRVPLGHGRFALIDDADAARVGAHSWCLWRKKSDPDRCYAQRSIRLGRGRKAPKTQLFLHRFIAGAQPGQFVDHVNGNGLDCRRENLRICTPRQNATNVTRSANQKRGGFKGVGWHPGARKWQAGICAGPVNAQGKRSRIHLGLFTSPEEAARAYDNAAVEYFGEFAALNFPRGDGPLDQSIDTRVSELESALAKLTSWRNWTRTMRPLDEWHEDDGSALWWRPPIEEPPYAGSPLDDDWPGYHTHWTPVVIPDEGGLDAS